MNLESEKVEINNSAERVFAFLTDFNNFQQLMPSQITNWKSSTEMCSFTINGMATLGMQISNKTPNSKIEISSSSDKPFGFKLFVLITETSPNTCTGQLSFEAEMNSMLQMMVEKPLQNFLNHLALRMKEIK